MLFCSCYMGQPWLSLDSASLQVHTEDKALASLSAASFWARKVRASCCDAGDITSGKAVAWKHSHVFTTVRDQHTDPAQGRPWNSLNCYVDNSPEASCLMLRQGPVQNTPCSLNITLALNQQIHKLQMHWLGEQTGSLFQAKGRKVNSSSICEDWQRASKCSAADEPVQV